MNRQVVAILSDVQSEDTENRGDVSVGVHQQVLVVLRQELLDQLVACFVDRLNDDTSLLWLKVETATLGLRD